MKFTDTRYIEGSNQRWTKLKPFLGTLIQWELLSAKRGNSIATIGHTEMRALFTERKIPRGISLSHRNYLILSSSMKEIKELTSFSHIL